MKSSDGFDARRLRSKGTRNWGARFSALLSFLLVVAGLALIAAGIAALTLHPVQLTDLNGNPTAAGVTCAAGVLVAYVGLWVRRRSRRRSRRVGELNMAPHLMKKHD